jgi:hypothetical protein
MQNKKITIISALCVLIFVIIIYIRALPPTVWFIDSGELASVAITLGIAHPTGYPLFTLISHIFSWLPVGTEIYRNNLLSGVFCALGAFMMFFYMHYLLGLYNPLTSSTEDKTSKKSGQQKAASKDSKLPNTVKISIVIFTCLTLAFSKTYWFVVKLGKVYPIHVFFIITMMLLFLNAIFIQQRTSRSDDTGNSNTVNKFFLMFAYALGLAFSNHMTTILITPAWLTLIIVSGYKDLTRLFKVLGTMALFFIISITVYLYLPIRASENPIFIWGNPVTFEKLIWHISGKQFQVWIFSGEGSLTIFLVLLILLLIVSVTGLIKYKSISPLYHFSFFIGLALITYFILSGANEIVSKQFKHFFDSLWTEFGTGMVLLAIPGVYRLSKMNGKIYYFTLLTFFTCVFYSVNYDIHDIDSYFLLAYITLSVWIGFGALSVYELISKYVRSSSFVKVFPAIIVIIGFAGLGTNYSYNDASRDYAVEEYTMNIFNNVPQNSIIISSQWDFWLASSWYYHFVRNVRPDIVAIDKELLRRSWYFKFLERNYPEIYNNTRPEIDRFLVELNKFEHNIPYDQLLIMKEFEDLLTSLVVNNPGRKVFTTWEIEQNKSELFAKDYVRIPDGILFRLVKNDPSKKLVVDDYKIYDFKFTPTTVKDYYHETLMGSYAAMLTASATYLSSVNRNEDALKYLDIALTAIPNYGEALRLRSRLQH